MEIKKNFHKSKIENDYFFCFLIIFRFGKYRHESLPQISSANSNLWVWQMTDGGLADTLTLAYTSESDINDQEPFRNSLTAR